MQVEVFLFRWTCNVIDTSSHLPGGTFVANLRVMHGVMMSGLRYTQYSKLCKAAGVGCCTEQYHHSISEVYATVTGHIARYDMLEALNEEEATHIEASIEKNQNYYGISNVSDARYGWRKNAAQSDIVALGYKTYKVLFCETVSHADDPCSQRHEIEGVRRMYDYFDNNHVSIDIHGHDRNSSVNKYVAQQPGVRNNNDTWHAAKSIARDMRKIATGPKYLEGKSWHHQLQDKAASVKPHCYYAMKNCNGDIMKLRHALENIPKHYKGDHEHCPDSSRCKTDAGYIPSKIIITEPKAEMLLTNAIKSLQIYKTPQDYTECIDTHYVESFNNASLQFHDKRIAISATEYRRRTNMAVLDWNENVDREYTSIRSQLGDTCNRRNTGKKND